MNELYDDVRRSWKAFASHARGCSACAPLGRHMNKNTAEPPYALIVGCCKVGKPLAEAWVYACKAAIETYRDRFRPHIA